MAKSVKSRQSAALATPTDLGANATKDISGGLNILLADVFALYMIASPRAIPEGSYGASQATTCAFRTFCVHPGSGSVPMVRYFRDRPRRGRCRAHRDGRTGSAG